VKAVEFTRDDPYPVAPRSKEVQLKRSKASIIVIVIGVIIAVLAPVWKWAIAPAFMKIPDDIEITSVYKGTIKMYADPEKMEFYPEGQQVDVPVAITRRDFSVPEKSDSEAAVIREQLEVVDADGNVFFEWDRYYALNRKNARNLPGHNSDTDRDGWYVMVPMGAEKITYQMWDDDTELTADAKFVKEETRDGNDFKDVAVYVYKAEGDVDRMVEPPMGLPKQLSGKAIKEVLGDPTLTLADDTMLPIEYYKTGSTSIVVEPRTGSMVELPDYHEEYFVNASLPGQPPEMIPIAVLDYKQTAESVAEAVDASAKYFGLLDLVTMWLPLMLLVVGLMLIIVGVLLGVRGRGAGVAEVAETQGEPPEE